MKVAVETRAYEEKTGIGTYVRNLVGQLEGFSPEISLQRLPPLSHQLLLPLWLNVTIPGDIYSNKPDIVHFTKSDVPRKKVLPTVVTIYDIIPLLIPESQSLLRRRYWPAALKRAAAHSDHVITISEASKSGIMEHLSVPAEKITVTPLAVDTSHFYPIALRDKKQRPYVLFVGRWDLRKNIPALIRAFARVAKHIPHELVIAGRPADKPINLRAVVQEAGIIDRVRFEENVAYADLPALYSGADLFVQPSIFEGWGFPPQEAMACGTPVLVSGGEPLPELVGDAGKVVPFTSNNIPARLSDTAFEEGLAAAMQEILEDESLRMKMSQAGLEQIKTFSWQLVGEKTIQVYKGLL